MKALSVREPWASMIAAGEKSIETRPWWTSYRGDLLICASRKPPMKSAGFALCIVRLVDCRPMTKDDEQDARCAVYPGANAWVLEHVRRIVPVRIRGEMGLFEILLNPNVLKFEDGPAVTPGPFDLPGLYPPCS